VRSVRRVAVFIDWLRTLFDPKIYPWFGDEFIHPADIRPSPVIVSAQTPLPVPARQAKVG
jgi:hypothetical protein